MTRSPGGHIWNVPTVHENMSKPVVLVFAGPNGSGKSTIAQMVPHYGVYINADDLKREYGLSDLEAAQKSEALRNMLLDKNSDFTFETVLSTDRNLHLLHRAKESCYEILCIYVLTCNADINVARVKSRVLEGGHDVPVDKIRSRYKKALELLPKIIKVCDKILIYDNSVMPFLVFKKDEGWNEYFEGEIWALDMLRELLKQ